jgi:hypothetical protein
MAWRMAVPPGWRFASKNIPKEKDLAQGKTAADLDAPSGYARWGDLRVPGGRLIEDAQSHFGRGIS